MSNARIKKNTMTFYLESELFLTSATRYAQTPAW